MALLCHFPYWAVPVLSTAAIVAQAVRHRRWSFRLASSAIFAAYAAQLLPLAVYTWTFRFVAAFVLCFAAAFCWGLRVDELD